MVTAAVVAAARPGGRVRCHDLGSCCISWRPRSSRNNNSSDEINRCSTTSRGSCCGSSSSSSSGSSSSGSSSSTGSSSSGSSSSSNNSSINSSGNSSNRSRFPLCGPVSTKGPIGLRSKRGTTCMSAYTISSGCSCAAEEVGEAQSCKSESSSSNSSSNAASRRVYRPVMETSNSSCSTSCSSTPTSSAAASCGRSRVAATEGSFYTIRRSSTQAVYCQHAGEQILLQKFCPKQMNVTALRRQLPLLLLSLLQLLLLWGAFPSVYMVIAAPTPTVTSNGRVKEGSQNSKGVQRLTAAIESLTTEKRVTSATQLAQISQTGAGGGGDASGGVRTPETAAAAAAQEAVNAYIKPHNHLKEQTEEEKEAAAREKERWTWHGVSESDGGVGQSPKKQEEEEQQQGPVPVDGEGCIIFAAEEGDVDSCDCPEGFILCNVEDVKSVQDQMLGAAKAARHAAVMRALERSGSLSVEALENAPAVAAATASKAYGGSVEKNERVTSVLASTAGMLFSLAELRGRIFSFLSHLIPGAKMTGSSDVDTSNEATAAKPKKDSTAASHPADASSSSSAASTRVSHKADSSNEVAEKQAAAKEGAAAAAADRAAAAAAARAAAAAVPNPEKNEAKALEDAIAATGAVNADRPLEGQQRQLSLDQQQVSEEEQQAEEHLEAQLPPELLEAVKEEAAKAAGALAPAWLKLLCSEDSRRGFKGHGVQIDYEVEVACNPQASAQVPVFDLHYALTSFIPPSQMKTLQAIDSTRVARHCLVADFYLCRPAPPTHPQVDCEVSPWSPWSSSCRDNVQVRKRTILRSGQHGGTACVHNGHQPSDSEISDERTCPPELAGETSSESNTSTNNKTSS